MNDVAQPIGRRFFWHYIHHCVVLVLKNIRRGEEGNSS